MQRLIAYMFLLLHFNTGLFVPDTGAAEDYARSRQYDEISSSLEFTVQEVFGYDDPTPDTEDKETADFIAQPGISVCLLAQCIELGTRPLPHITIIRYPDNLIQPPLTQPKDILTPPPDRAYALFTAFLLTGCTLASRIIHLIASTMKPIYLCLGGIIVLAACQRHETTVSKNTAALPDSVIQSLQTAPVTLEEMTEIVKLNGRIQPAELHQAKVFSLVSGRVRQVKAELGDYVKSGAVLATLQSPEVVSAASEVSAAAADLAIAQRLAETRKDLFAASLITAQEHQEATQLLEKARAGYAKAKQLSAITGGTGEAGYTIKSPISGYVIEKNISNNSEVRPDNNETMFMIADLSSVWVIADVYESDINNIHQGDPVTLTTLASPDKVYNGKVDKIYNVLDPENRTMKVRINMPNPNMELKPEMYTRVYLSSRTGNAPGLCIPAKAIVLDNSHRYVIVKKGNNLAIREVRIIKRIGDRAFVEGLTKDEQVVIQSQVFIYDAINVQ